MVITAQTNLSEIVNSKKIIDTFTSTTNGVKTDCTMPRLNSISTEIEKAAIKDAKIAGATDMYLGGKNVKSAYEGFHSSLTSLQDSVKTAAISKEISELQELIKKVTKKIDDLDDDKDDYSRKKKYTDDEEKIKEYDQKIRDINRSLEGYRLKKEQAIARLNRLGEEYVEEGPTSSSGALDSTAGLTHDQHTEYSISLGEMVMINGQTYIFQTYAVDQNGNAFTYYSDHKGVLHVMDAQGNFTETEYFDWQPFRLWLATDANNEGVYYYTMNSITTNNETAADMGLPPSDIFVQGPQETVYDTSMQQTVVFYGEPNPNDITTVSSSDALHAAANEHVPVIQVDAAMLDDNKTGLRKIFTMNEDVYANETNGITLVYDSSKGMYYPLDQYGNYSKDSSDIGGYTPEYLQQFTVVK